MEPRNGMLGLRANANGRRRPRTLHPSGGEPSTKRTLRLDASPLIGHFEDYHLRPVARRIIGCLALRVSEALPILVGLA